MCRERGTARVRRERWLQVLDGMRRQRGIRTCSTRRPRRPQFRRGAFCDVGGVCANCKGMNHRIERERLIFFATPKSSRRPRLERRRLRGAAVRRRHLLIAAAASDRPPTLRPAGGGGVWCARQSRLPHFAVWRLDARLSARGSIPPAGCYRSGAGGRRPP